MVKKLLRLLREARPEIIGGLALELFLALIGALCSTGVWFWGILGVGAIWLACAYVFLKYTKPSIELPARVKYKKKLWKYAAHSRRLALAGCVIIPLLALCAWGYQSYLKAQPPSEVTILVADFDGPEPQKYRVTETVWQRLNLGLQKYNDMRVERLEGCFTTSSEARVAGEKRKAAIIIWGWYGVTEEAVPLSVHFELLYPPKYMPVLGAEAQGKVQAVAAAELESFALQTRLSEEMAYLSLVTVGMTCYAAEDWEGAVARFSDALSQTVESVPALNQSIVYDRRADAYLHKGDYDRAITDYDRVIQLQPHCDICTYHNRGFAYLYKEDYDRAIADFDQAIQIQPDFAVAYGNRGLAYHDKGDYDRAIADFDQAMQLQPDCDACIYYYHGLAYYYRKGDYDRAIADFDQAMQLQPDCEACIYYYRGLAYLEKGNYDRAIADLDQALQLQPDCEACTYYYRGLAYLEKGDYDRAIADFDQAIRLKPNYVDAHYGRGNALYQQGNGDAAIVDLNQVIVLDPNYANAFYVRGLVYIQRGKEEKAAADFIRFLELSDDPYWQQQAEEQLQTLGER